MFTLDKQQLAELCASFAKQGALEVLSLIQPKDDRVSYRQACKEYTRTNVDRWIEEGRLTVVRSGPAKSSPRHISRRELAELFASDRLYVAEHRYLRDNKLPPYS